MNRKQFIILIGLLIVLGGAGKLLQTSHQTNASAGEEGAGKKLMGDSFPFNDVTLIHLKQDTNEVTLVKKQDIWKVAERKDYPANFSSISDFLLKLKDIKVVQKEEIGASQLGRLQLAPQGQGTNSGLVAEFKAADEKVLATLTLGKKHFAKPTAQQKQFGMGDEGFPDGRYVMAGKDTSSALLIPDALASAEPKPESWLSKDFFKVERAREISVSYPVSSNSWTIVRDTESGNWKLQDAKGDEKLDDARASGVATPFASVSFDDVLTGDTDATALGMSNPTVVNVKTFDDFVYKVQVGIKLPQGYPLTLSVSSEFPAQRVPAKDEKPEDKTKADKAWADRRKQLESNLADARKFENWTYLVPSWSLDALLKERKDLLVEKKAESKPGETPADGTGPDTPELGSPK